MYASTQYIYIKKIQTITKLWSAQEFPLEIHSEEIGKQKHVTLLRELCPCQILSNYLKQYGS